MALSNKLVPNKCRRLSPMMLFGYICRGLLRFSFYVSSGLRIISIYLLQSFLSAWNCDNSFTTVHIIHGRWLAEKCSGHCTYTLPHCHNQVTTKMQLQHCHIYHTPSLRAMKLKHVPAFHVCTNVLVIESAQISIISFWNRNVIYRTEDGALLKCASSIDSRLATDFRLQWSK